MRAITLLAVLLGLGGCGKPAPEMQVVARVNGKEITRAQFEGEAAREVELQLRGRENVRAGMEQRIRESVLRRMIDDAVVDQKAAALGIAAPAAEVERRYAAFRERFASEAELGEHLARTRNSVQGIKAQMDRDIKRERIAERLGGPVELPDEQLAAHYERNRSRYVQKERVRVLRIVIPLRESATAQDRAAAHARAQALRSRAAVAATDFAALARSESKAPEAAAGGDLGWVQPGTMPGEFDRVVFALRPGALSPVMQTRSGYEFVKVVEKAPRSERAFAEVRQEIREELAEAQAAERRAQVLEQLRREARVEQLFLL